MTLTRGGSNKVVLEVGFEIYFREIERYIVGLNVGKQSS